MIQLLPASLQIIQELLEHNDQLGQYLFSGTSNAINPCVQQLLEASARQERALFYFLCSGSQGFHVPCYLSGNGTSQHGELPSVEAILDGLRRKQFSPQQKAKEREQQLLAGSHNQASPLLVIECITPPQAAESAFLEQLLFFAIHKTLSVIIFLHKDEKEQLLEAWSPQASSQENLLLLYLCGGRVRATDWYQLCVSQSTLSGEKGTPSWMTTRHVGPEIWLCYARQHISAWAATAFGRLEQKERARLIRKVLHGVQYPADYPILALAIQAERSDLALTRHIFPAVDYVLAEPRIMAKYFYRLRQSGKQARDTQLVATATLNYLASLLCLPDIPTIRLYKVLCHHDDHFEKRSLARLYGELGQRLVKAKDELRLEAAAECFQRSRRSLDQIEDLGEVEKQSALAAIANGEALLAFKRGDPDLACQIEQAGLARLPQVSTNLQQAAQEVLLRTNLGDVYLRLRGDRGAALKQYQIAHSLAIKWSSIAMQCYVVPKLASVLLQIGQQEQAIEILAKFLAQPPANGSDPSPTIEEKIALKAQLTLAQAYWQSGLYRNAALWYWRLLRRSHYLALTTVKGIALNLQRCRPEMSQRLKTRLERLVISHEETLDSLKQMRGYLSTM